jgi:uridine phosphorylase
MIDGQTMADRDRNGPRTASQNRMSWLVTAAQTVERAAAMDPKRHPQSLPAVAVLTFSRAVLDRLQALCGLEDMVWLESGRHPYATAQTVKRGIHAGREVVVLVPPMGGSPLACVIEDLAAGGVRAVFLVCAAWSLGGPVKVGDLLIPAVSLGPDGTSIHYGNSDGVAPADPATVRALGQACCERDLRYHVGANGSCEAFYRITAEMADRFRAQGCLCMDNGEASTLYAVSRALGIMGGVLFQPYIDLRQGWRPEWLRDNRYREACERQAEVVLAAMERLGAEGTI